MRGRLRRSIRRLLPFLVLVVAMALADRISAGEGSRSALVRAAVLYGGLAAALAMQGGVVSTPLIRGTALLWIQKPVSPVAFFGRRLLAAWGASLCAVVATGAAAWLVAGFGRPGIGVQVRDDAAAACVLATMWGGIVFALSSWRVRHDVAGAVFLGVALAGLQAWLAVDPTALGALSTVGRGVGMPLQAIEGARRLLLGEPRPGAAADLGRIAAWTGAWWTLALAGLARSLRSPLPSV